MSLVTIAEAATYLGVSKATLRNWDREGKLRAKRHPLNDYRCYQLEDLRHLKVQTSLLDDEVTTNSGDLSVTVADAKSTRRLVARLHSILRDEDGDSNLLQRFDELTKLLFIKLADKRRQPEPANGRPRRDDADLVRRWRSEYSALAKQYSAIIPQTFATLRCSDAALRKCAEVLEAVVLANRDLDVKGLAYEEVIRGTFDKSDNQQFFTPPQVVSFMCQFLKPELGGLVMDPACGTAGFLVELVKSGVKTKRFIGVEVDERLAWVSSMNLLAHGASAFRVDHLSGAGSLGDGLSDDLGTINAILTNPPFGSDLSDEDVLEKYALGKGKPSRRRGILFLERCHQLLRDEGVLGIILDEGVLNLPSAHDVREFILKSFEILGIVSLPETAFLPYANVAASILFLRKSSKPKRNTRVFFARADVIGRRPNGDDDIEYEAGGSPRINSDLPAILTQWKRHSAGESIEASDRWYAANVSRQLAEESALRLDFRFHHPSRAESKRLLDQATFELKPVAEICTEVTETVVPSVDLADQVILYTGLANIEADSGVVTQAPTPAAALKSAVKAYDVGDILFARMRPNLRKVALIAFAEGGYCSPECVVLRVRRDFAGTPVFDPELLSIVLRSDLVFGQIMHLVAGIGRPRLNTADLRRVLIPVPPREIQASMLQHYRANLASAHELTAQAAALNERAAALASGAVNSVARRMVGESHD